MNHTKLEDSINYKFNDLSMLQEALSHPSLHGYASFSGRDYEKLEFLGDAVVNLIITETLYSNFQTHKEGDLAKMRAYLVSKEFMVKKAKELDIGMYILMGSGEEVAGGRDNPNNLENVLEAIMGAIYLDGGLDSVRNVILNLWGNISPDILLTSDPKSTLQEMLQDRGIRHSYNVVEKQGQPHSPTFKVMLEIDGGNFEYGSGNSIKMAEKEAAIKMLAKLKEAINE